MRSSLLPLTSGSDASAADREAKELAQQINFKVATELQLLQARAHTDTHPDAH